MWSSWYLRGVPSIPILIDSSPSAIRTYSVFYPPKNASSFPATSAQWSFTRHCCWHRNFYFCSSFFQDVLEFLIFRINEGNTTQSSGIIELWVLDSPFFLFFAFWCIRHLFPHYLATHCRVLRSFLFPHQILPGPCTSVRWFLNQENESRETCPCMRQVSFSINIPVIVNMFVRHHV